MTPESYRDFWPHYLREHSRPATRGLHFFGSLLGLGLLVAAVALGQWRLLVGALLVGYGFAWFSHLAIEGNRPATFRHPWWSFVSDWRMLGLAMTGRLDAELRAAGLPTREEETADERE